MSLALHKVNNLAHYSTSFKVMMSKIRYIYKKKNSLVFLLAMSKYENIWTLQRHISDHIHITFYLGDKMFLHSTSCLYWWCTHGIFPHRSNASYIFSYLHVFVMQFMATDNNLLHNLYPFQENMLKTFFFLPRICLSDHMYNNLQSPTKKLGDSIISYNVPLKESKHLQGPQ